MHKWRLLLFAFLAVLEPIASFTERSLVDGREQCCDRDIRNEGRSYGTYRFRKTSPDIRPLNPQEIRDSRRYDVRTDSVLNRISVERRIQDHRSERDRERASPLLNSRSQALFRFTGPVEDLEHRESNRFSSRVVNQDYQNRDISRTREQDFSNSIRHDRIANRESTSRLSRENLMRNANERSTRTAMSIRRETTSHRPVEENGQMRATMQRARDNLAEPINRMVQRHIRFNSRVMKGERRREISERRFVNERRPIPNQRSLEISRSPEPKVFHHQRESGLSERRDQRPIIEERRITSQRDARIFVDSRDMKNQDRRLSRSRREQSNRSTMNSRSPTRSETSAEWRQSLSERDSREVKERQEMLTKFVNPREQRSTDRTRLGISGVRRDSTETRILNNIISPESRLVRDREMQSVRRDNQRMITRNSNEQNPRPNRKLTDNSLPSLDHNTKHFTNQKISSSDSRVVRDRDYSSESSDQRIIRTNVNERDTRSSRRLIESRSSDRNRAMEQEFGNRRSSRVHTEHHEYSREGESRSRDIRVVPRNDFARQQSIRKRTVTPERDLQERDGKVERSIRRSFRNNERIVQDSRRDIRVSGLRQDNNRLTIERHERSEYQETRRNIRKTVPTTNIDYANKNKERRDTRFRDTQFARSVLSFDKTLPEDQTPIKWHYLLYTLQGIYICGVLVQLISAKESGKKFSALQWWAGPTKQLIKLD